MGLGFATLVDPQRGATTPVLGQFFTVFALLTYLAVGGHLTLLGALSRSFQSMPIGEGHLDPQLFWSVADWGARVFESGLLIALPATVALIVVNLALGVVSRAAPQLNLFAVGFPLTMSIGFAVLLWSLDGLMTGVSSLIGTTFDTLSAIIGDGATTVR
jgi:flagellar biosynthesis protein FliR